METLPHEMVATISQYLTVKDLVSCCAVSPEWREAFGCDEVWWPWCDADSEEYLRTTPCRVEPKFTSPESENSTLSPLGRWRTAYMREKHLWKNWMDGNCVKDEISDPCQQVAFLNNDFIITVRKDFIGLIDTTLEHPVCIARCINTIGYSQGCRVSVVRSDTFIIWNKKNTVQVIGVDLESCVLSVKHSFCVSEGNGIVKYDVVNTVFVGVDDNFLHIWDLEKGTKLKTESALDGYQLARLGHDEKCENVGVIGHYEECNQLNVINMSNLAYFNAPNYRLQSYFRIYNVKDLRFWPFTKHTPTMIQSFAFVGHYVALALDSSVQVYNYQTSQCLHTVVGSGSVVYTVGDCFLFNKKKDLVKLSPLTGIVTCLHSNILDFKCFNEKLFIVCPTQDQRPQLWKITPKSTVKTVVLKPSNMLTYDKVTSNQTYSKVYEYINRERSGLRVELCTYW